MIMFCGNLVEFGRNKNILRRCLTLVDETKEVNFWSDALFMATFWSAVWDINLISLACNCRFSILDFNRTSKIEKKWEGRDWRNLEGTEPGELFGLFFFKKSDTVLV